MTKSVCLVFTVFDEHNASYLFLIVLAISLHPERCVAMIRNMLVCTASMNF